MKYYIDITLLPSDDIGIHFLWSKIMMQVHLALVEIQDRDSQTPIAVSFPHYKLSFGKTPAFIGDKLRLFSRELHDFERLNIAKWLNRFEDYIHIKTVKDVPTNIVQYESFGRLSKSGNVDKHIRRRMKRHHETEEQAAHFYEGYEINAQLKALPFIKMKSLGSGEEFNMVIRRTPATLQQIEYRFSSYGFNRKAALPIF